MHVTPSSVTSYLGTDWPKLLGLGLPVPFLSLGPLHHSILLTTWHHITNTAELPFALLVNLTGVASLSSKLALHILSSYALKPIPNHFVTSHA